MPQMNTASAKPIAPVGPTAIPGDSLDASALDAAGVGLHPGGAPGEGPSSGPIGGALPPSPSPDGVSTGTGQAGGHNGGADVGGGVAMDDFSTRAAEGFFDVLKTATTPDALEAQNIILRRIALQGDVVPSRVPPPRNITEIGGYLNLLTNLNELDMRSQVLAGILGVAGPNPPLGWIGMSTPLSFSPMVNDRPPGPGQAALPVTVLVRSDYVDLLRSAVQYLHDRGCSLPLRSGPLALPPVGGFATATLDPLDYIGRALYLSHDYALSDPNADVIALVRPVGSVGPYQIALRSTGAPTVPVAATDYEALQRSQSGIDSVTLTSAAMVMLAPVLNAAGFSSKTTIPVPGAATANTWAKLVNVTGLASGTRLGDELRLLHSATEIAGSALAAMQNWRWNGAAFAA